MKSKRLNFKFAPQKYKKKLDYNKKDVKTRK